MPNAEYTENLIELAKRIFEPIRVHFNKPIHISSGYRSKELNAAIGGAKNSQHTKGQAIDIDQGDRKQNMEIFDFIKNNLEFDQLILEYPVNGLPDWVHVSYDTDGKQRKEILVAKKVNGKTTYTKYND